MTGQSLSTLLKNTSVMTMMMMIMMMMMIVMMMIMMMIMVLAVSVAFLHASLHLQRCETNPNAVNFLILSGFCKLFSEK